MSFDHKDILSEIRKLAKMDGGEVENPLDYLQSIKPKLKDSVFQNIPEILKLGVSCFKTRHEKETFLIASLSMISGILPNYYTRYFKKDIYPNLFLYIVADYASGKGIATHAMESLSKISDLLENENIEILNNYKKEYAKYKAQLEEERAMKIKDYEKIAEIEANPPDEPKTKKVFSAFNNSESNFVRTFVNNDNRTILFSTEGDVVTNSLSNEYNQLRSLFNAAWQHEDYPYERLNANLLLHKPKISFLISSTLDQFLRLIKDANDGFFSRLLIFGIDHDPKFNNPFDEDHSKFDLEFEKIQHFYLSLFEFLRNCENDRIEFRLKPHQQEIFLQQFQAEKTEAIDTEKGLGGIVNRRGVNFMRIAMILSILNSFEHRTLTKGCVIICEDWVFKTCQDIMNLFYWFTLKHYDILPKKTFEPKIIEQGKKELETKAEIIKLSQSGLSVREIASKIFGQQKVNSKKSYVYRVVKEYQNSV